MAWNNTLAWASLEFKVKAKNIIGKRRFQYYTLIRSGVAYVLRNRDGLSYPRIAMILGGRDHSSVIHSVKNVYPRFALEECGLVAFVAKQMTFPRNGVDPRFVDDFAHLPLGWYLEEAPSGLPQYLAAIPTQTSIAIHLENQVPDNYNEWVAKRRAELSPIKFTAPIQEEPPPTNREEEQESGKIDFDAYTMDLHASIANASIMLRDAVLDAAGPLGHARFV